MAGWETVTRARIVRGELRHAQRRPAIAGQVTSLSGEIGGVIKCAALAAAQVHEGAAAVLSAAIKPVVSHSVRATEVLPAWVAVVVAVVAVAAVVVAVVAVAAVVVAVVAVAAVVVAVVAVAAVVVAGGGAKSDALTTANHTESQ